MSRRSFHELRGTLHVCTLETGLAEMTRAERRSEAAVLSALRLQPRVSVFEVTAHQDLANTFDRLERAGKIKQRPPELSSFPWMEFDVLEPMRGDAP